jgi:hypothetical protein
MTMKLAFFGDVHGRVPHALGAAVVLQKRRGIRLDALVQVGDLGAFPSPERLDDATRRFIASNPAEGDFFRLLDPSPQWAQGVRAALGQVPAFLGLIESDKLDYNQEAYDGFLAAEPGSVDILVTHDGPHGLSEYRGVPQGSAKLSRLIEHLQPRLHVGGHHHHQNGPRRYGSTVSYTLADLVGAKSDHRTSEPVNPLQQVKAGSIGILDTETYAFEYVQDPWLAEASGDEVDLAGLVAAG